MSGSNGVIRITDEGMRKFLFRENPDVIAEVDVVKLYDMWIEKDWKFRDKEGKLLPDKRWERREAVVEFVKLVILDAMDRLPPGRDELRQAYNAAAQELTDTAALAFHKHLEQEVDKLRHFFEPDSGKEESSPPSSELIFSQ